MYQSTQKRKTLNSKTLVAIALCLTVVLAFLFRSDVFDGDGKAATHASYANTGWTSYTGWDATWTRGDSGKLLYAMASYHDNGREDRRFNFAWRQLQNDELNNRLNVELSQTAWDGTWTRKCPTNFYISKIWSQHDNGREDRIFRISCTKSGKYGWGDCYDSGVNGWDAWQHVVCQHDYSIAGIWSQHDNGREDRRYRITCCKMVTTSSATVGAAISLQSNAHSTGPSAWDGEWQYPSTSKTTGYYLTGLESRHDNGREDREFTFRWRKPSASKYREGSSANNQLTQTAYDQEWTRECPRNEFLTHIWSKHDNGREDRIWRFTCIFTPGVGHGNCGPYTSINGWDGYMNYNCPTGRAVAGIWSRHDNGREDRLFQVKCCEVKEVNTHYAISNAQGQWVYAGSQSANAQATVTMTQGVTTGTSNSNSFGWGIEVGVTVEASAKFLGSGGSVSTTVTGSTSWGIEATRYAEQTVESSCSGTCDVKSYGQRLYQWRFSGTESISGSNQNFNIDTCDWLCISQQLTPKCGLFMCKDEQCQTCYSNPAAAMAARAIKA